MSIFTQSVRLFGVCCLFLAGAQSFAKSDIRECHSDGEEISVVGRIAEVERVTAAGYKFKRLIIAIKKPLCVVRSFSGNTFLKVNKLGVENLSSPRIGVLVSLTGILKLDNLTQYNGIPDFIEVARGREVSSGVVLSVLASPQVARLGSPAPQAIMGQSDGGQGLSTGKIAEWTFLAVTISLVLLYFLRMVSKYGVKNDRVASGSIVGPTFAAQVGAARIDPAVPPAKVNSSPVRLDSASGWVRPDFRPAPPPYTGPRSKKYIEQWRVDYVDAQGEATSRNIWVRRYRPRLQFIEAWCGLRMSERTFKPDRCRKIVDTRTGEIIDIGHWIAAQAALRKKNAKFGNS